MERAREKLNIKFRGKYWSPKWYPTGYRKIVHGQMWPAGHVFETPVFRFSVLFFCLQLFLACSNLVNTFYL